MDKRNQMENPFFDPDKPGSIFVGMDRYHQYSPHQPRNALTFIQKGDADSLFRKFLIDNIKEAECCPYIPDTELLRFDLANMRQVPPVDTHTPFEEYISKELLPYFQEHCIPPAKRISLRDAVYTYKYKNEPDGGILKKYLMQEPAYLEFRLQQQEKRTLYRCQPRYTFPLKVVENDFGYLIFSGNEIGRNGFREHPVHHGPLLRPALRYRPSGRLRQYVHGQEPGSSHRCRLQAVQTDGTGLFLRFLSGILYRS